MQEFGTDASGSLQVDTLVPLAPDGSDELDATTLAREIQRLVRVHSLPHATTDGSQQPQIKDPRLISLLSNASFMNDSSLKRKPSVWTVLENIHCTSPNPHLYSSTTSSPTHVGSEAHPLKEDELTSSSSNIYPNQLSNESLPSVAFSDTSSIMVYSPLFPTQSDFVELAELAPYDTDSGEVEERGVVVNSGDDRGIVGDTQEVVVGQSSWALMWPFSIWYRQNQTQQGISQTLSPLGSGGPQQQQSAGFMTSSRVGTNNVDTNSPTTQRIRTVKSQRSIRAWVPSSSKISVQAFWWGYRLYFPPPVLEILSDKTLEAAKRAAIITAALTWFFSNLPINVFPPPFQSSLVLLQGLIPLLGLIGKLISWAWSTIGSYDVGYGVTLTATWILPVALIPGTCYERDFPKSPQLSPPHLPISSPIHYPTTISSNSPNSLCFTPSASTSSVLLTLNPSTTPPSPRIRIRTPRFSSRMGSPINSNNSGINAIPPHLITYNTTPPSPPITPISTSTPIPVPPTPIDLPPIPPELPFSPKLVNQLLRGPVLQTVPLPDVDDGNNGDGVGGVGVGVGVGVGADLDKSSGLGGVVQISYKDGD